MYSTHRPSFLSSLSASFSFIVTSNFRVQHDQGISLQVALYFFMLQINITTGTVASGSIGPQYRRTALSASG
jgi:hypothetical protein